MIKRIVEVSNPSYLRLKHKQFGRIEVFYGKKRFPVEKAPEQLSFF
jgi:hypothetical protein